MSVDGALFQAAPLTEVRMAVQGCFARGCEEGFDVAGRTRSDIARNSANMTKTVAAEVRAFILENYLFTSETSALGDEESLTDRGIIDSTGIMELIFFIEETFGVVVADEEMLPENLDSVHRIAAFIQRKRAAA